MITLFDMRPCFALFDVAHHRMAYPIIRSNVTLRSPVIPDRPYLFCGKFRSGVFLSKVLAFGASSSVYHVLDVLGLRSWDKMSRIHAARIITLVPNNYAGCPARRINPPAGLLIRFNMCRDVSFAGPKPAVARVGPNVSIPRPAFVGTADIDV